ncbi:Hydrogenase maturation factor [Haladaptatus litoreus]|uniref:Hydrogenase maturation factor n=1 Tax=Haladaptatus litoreus TaxID=553468 RepID=A0A1N6VZ99_9EURY|nr:AIR synthase family protein [Haladaptatus litoreus]SIQ82976.1 Hydrogenase maturation factor [Haladaptatus litoreus]
MTDLGKIDRDFFDEHVYPYLGAERDDELLGPRHGVDFGVIELDEQVVALATDPISILPELGFERAGWFAFHVVMSDVAVSGLKPTHLAVDFNLPPEITDEEFATVWKTFDREAKKLGVSVVTGHTARYSGCQYPWVGGATTLAVGKKENLVRPDGAKPGDSVLVTKGPGVETAGFLVTLFEEHIDLPEETIEQAKERFYDMSPVEDALVAADAGNVTAMHDATECGIHGALVEMARAGNVRFDVSHEDVPILPGVLEACDFFEVNPWESTTEGTLVLTVAPKSTEAVLSALSDAGIPAAEMGTVREGDGVYVDGSRIEHPDVDPSWQVFAEYADRE